MDTQIEEKRSSLRGPYRVDGQIAGDLMWGYGSCDPSFRDAKTGLVNHRYDTGFITGTRAAGPPATVTFTAGNSVQLFTAGETDPGSDAGFTTLANKGLTRTNLFTQGAPVDRGELFVSIGMAIELQRPCYFVTASQAQNYAPEFDAYDDQLRELVGNNVGCVFSYGNSACQYEMGPLMHWGGHYGAYGPVVSNGNVIPGSFHPFRAENVIAAQAESKQLTITLTIGQGGFILTEGASALNLAGALIGVPVRVSLIGYPICESDKRLCGFGQASSSNGASDMDAIVAAVAQRIRSGQ